MKRFLSLVIVIFLASLAVPQTLHAADATSVSMAFLEAEAVKLDPQTADALDDFQVLWTVCEGMVGYDSKTLAPIPGLATSWDISPDGLNYTFHLRSGVKFQNGRAMTADDVVYTFNRLANPDLGGGYASIILGNVAGFDAMQDKDPAKRAKALTGVKAVDPQTVQVTLTAPVSSFLNRMTLPGTMIVPKELADDKAAFNNHPVCTGPYKFDEWVHGDHITLSANPDYWGTKPTIQKITIRVIPQQSQQVLEYEAGNLDIASVSAADMPTLSADATYSKQLVNIPAPATFHFRLNLNDKATGDVRVRQAISLGIDRKAIVATILSGLGAPAQGLVPPTMTAYDPNFNPFPYNPDQAKKLLADAGYKDGVTLNVLTTTVESEVRTVEAIQQQLAKVGITLKINSAEKAVFSAASGKCDLQLQTVNWSQDYPDPENFDGLLIAGSSGSRKACGYDTYDGAKDMIDLYNKATVAPLGAARDAMFRQMEATAIGKLAVAIPLYYPVRTVLVNPRLSGVVIDSNSMARFAGITAK